MRGLRKMPGSDIFEYRTQIGGQQFQKSTGETSRREAERVARQFRREWEMSLHLKGERRKSGFSDELTIYEACDYYIKSQKAKDHISHGTLNAEIKAFKWMVSQIGKDVLMSEIDTATVARIVEARRRMPKVNSKREPVMRDDGKPQLIGPSSVNRYTSKLLKRVYIMARDELGVPVKPIKWSSEKITLPESGQRTRELKIEEEAVILADNAFRQGYGAAFKFALLTGLRKENFTRLKWSEVDLGNAEIKVWTKGRRGRKEHTIALDDEMMEILLAERGKHPVYVFTYAQTRTRKNPKTGIQEKKGQLTPITYHGFSSWYRCLVRRLGFDLTVHDLRRTAGSRVVRETNNLKAASQLLGHSDIETTAKHYAHLVESDMRKVLTDARAATREKMRKIAFATT